MGMQNRRRLPRARFAGLRASEEQQMGSGAVHGGGGGGGGGRGGRFVLWYDVDVSRSGDRRGGLMRELAGRLIIWLPACQLFKYVCDGQRRPTQK